MTRRQARLFVIVCTVLATVAFIALTIDSHRQFPRLTNEQEMTPEVLAGKAVWHRYNCTNCHTLLGEGAYYAPDLTKIAAQRGREYLRAFSRCKASFAVANQIHAAFTAISIDHDADEVAILKFSNRSAGQSFWSDVAEARPGRKAGESCVS